MNYDLALKLKEAGYPQNKDCDRDICYITYEGNRCWIPTLSELIESCGEEFGMLIQIPETGEQKHEWECLAKNSVGIGTKGQTPEEAVANLYLELHKNA